MANPNYCRRWLVTGSLCAALAVILGAFGSHGLERQMTDSGKEVREVQKTLDQWETGVRYHMLHALGMIVVSFVIGGSTNRSAHWAGYSFLSGVFLFSGGLYGYVLTGAKPLVLIVPLGGISFIVGWLLLAFFSARRQSTT